MECTNQGKQLGSLRSLVVLKVCVCISLEEGESWTAGSHFMDEFLSPMWNVMAGEHFSLAVCCLLLLFSFKFTSFDNSQGQLQVLACIGCWFSVLGAVILNLGSTFRSGKG